MEGNGNKKTIRNLLIYLGILIVILIISMIIFGSSRSQTQGYLYSDIKQFFCRAASRRIQIGSWHGRIGPEAE